ncbi:MAG TPA: FliA/WhiG family RNA polymerase sigma factor [Acidimicrobiales bacterium]|nr:FliA/WhiG family RNA polymerase sigma factor [Acidimicrobiales bacterium]
MTSNGERSTTRDQRRVEEDLVRSHLPLVQYVVAEVANRVPRHVTRSDLVSAGMIGLAQAARSFDASRGIAFDRYAGQRIRGAILDELRSRDWASRTVRAKARTVSSATDQLTASLGRTPTTQEVAERAGMERSAVESLAEDVHRAVVLNFDSLVTSGDGEGILPSDSTTPESTLLERERKAYLIDAVAALPERLRRVVVGYFFEELPMLALADELGVSESRISQMRAEALALMKDGMNSQLEPDLVVEQRPEGRVARRKVAYYATISDRSDFRSRLAAGERARGELLSLGARKSA